MRLLAVTALAAITVAGCGSTHSPTAPAPPPKPAATEVTTTPHTENSSCVIGPRGESVRVTFAGEAAGSYCSTAIRAWSNGTELWEPKKSLVANPGTEDHPVEVCNVVKGSESVAVETASGDESSATSVCGRLVHAGWVEETTE